MLITQNVNVKDSPSVCIYFFLIFNLLFISTTGSIINDYMVPGLDLINCIIAKKGLKGLMLVSCGRCSTF